MLTEIIRNLHPVDLHADLSWNLHRALLQRGIEVTEVSTGYAVNLCLRNGYAWYRPSFEFPIEHPNGDHAQQHREVRKAGLLWDDSTQYGKRRMQALEHIKAHAIGFHTSDGELLYTHRGKN